MCVICMNVVVSDSLHRWQWITSPWLTTAVEAPNAWQFSFHLWQLMPSHSSLSTSVPSMPTHCRPTEITARGISSFRRYQQWFSIRGLLSYSAVWSQAVLTSLIASCHSELPPETIFSTRGQLTRFSPPEGSNRELLIFCEYRSLKDNIIHISKWEVK